MNQIATVSALLDDAAHAMSLGRHADALRLLQRQYPIPRGWVPAIIHHAPPQWSRVSRRIEIQRNGTLYAGGRDWFTQTRAGLHIADQTNANPAGGQYVLRQTATHTALVAPRSRSMLPEAPATLIGSNQNYCHWLLDFLPRVPLAQANAPDLPLIVGQPLASYETASLRGLGISTDRLLFLPDHATTPFKRLVIPDLGTIDRVPHPDALGWLRGTFQHQRGSARRIWISRRGGSIRRVLNEDAVLDALAPFGFVQVELDGLTIQDQAALFAGAEVIAGPHGAGFANLAFADPGTRVVEIVPGDYFYCVIKQVVVSSEIRSAR